MRVLRQWQGRGELFAPGSASLMVGYYCQEIETTLAEPQPPILEMNGAITSDEVYTLIRWHRERTELTLETGKFSIEVYLTDPYHFCGAGTPAFKTT